MVLKSKTNGKSPEINKANKEEKEENSPKWVTENNNKEKLNEIKLVFNIKDDIQKRKEENENIPTLISNYKIKIFILLIKKKTLDINIHKVSFKDDKKGRNEFNKEIKINREFHSFIFNEFYFILLFNSLHFPFKSSKIFIYIFSFICSIVNLLKNICF